ncbi:uncharacterized protein LOC142361221 [Opisthocomus hoazin]|uniref:uncharacterized protein LOC142361221 n=1 Tax=Opisthocomus hoazin TaxID=30419 RepID=UPI003F530CD1
MAPPPPGPGDPRNVTPLSRRVTPVTRGYREQRWDGGSPPPGLGRAGATGETGMEGQRLGRGPDARDSSARPVTPLSRSRWMPAQPAAVSTYVCAYGVPCGSYPLPDPAPSPPTPTPPPSISSPAHPGSHHPTPGWQQGTTELPPARAGDPSAATTATGDQVMGGRGAAGMDPGCQSHPANTPGARGPPPQPARAGTVYWQPRYKALRKRRRKASAAAAASRGPSSSAATPRGDEERSARRRAARSSPERTGAAASRQRRSRTPVLLPVKGLSRLNHAAEP